MKYCPTCCSNKDESEFYKEKNSKDGLYYQCKKCKIDRVKQWKAQNKERSAATTVAWKHNNKEKVSAQEKTWKKNHLERVKENTQRWRADNLEYTKQQAAEWHSQNKEYRRQYKRRLYNDNVLFKIQQLLRARLYDALKGKAKGGSAVKDLGCTIDELKIYLESNFKPGMTWENWAIDGWHIDHIKPLSKFDLTDPNQIKIACNYKNLQPLWWYENLQKGDR